MRALLSVYDKTGIAQFAAALHALGWEIVSTGGTLREITSYGVEARSVSEVTGFPEILEGRVKTLHPMIHGGLLGRPGLASDDAQLQEHNISHIDLLAVNLYPFESTVRSTNASEVEAIEQIDIGGPAMLRAAAKNFLHVVPIVDPEDYDHVLDRLGSGGPDITFRRTLAAKAFSHTSAYDAAIAGFFWRADDSPFPAQITFAGMKALDLRYGENPHQRAAAYKSEELRGTGGVLAARQVQGKELSFNNLLDADAAWSAVREWDQPAAAIIKHTIPCGLALAPTLPVAYDRALAGDPVSAFGGIVASNRPMDIATAERISETFYEVVVAPGFDPEAVECLRRKRHLRLLDIPPDPGDDTEFDLKVVGGGWLMQEADRSFADESDWQVVTYRSPEDSEMTDLRFAWRAVRHVKSNAIVLASGMAIVGIGSGQPNRVESVAIAVRKAGAASVGSVLASDAFFPFPDGVQAAADAGVTAVIQPGGSVRDAEVIAAANEAGMAMVTTGRRHFKH